MFFVVSIWKARQMQDKKIPFFCIHHVYGFLRFQYTLTQTLEYFSIFTTFCLLSSPDSDEPGIHTFPLYFHHALVQA